MHGPMLTQVQLDQAAMQEKAAATFRAHDKENKSALDHDTMVAALTELGVLNGITAKKLSECALVAVSQSGVAVVFPRSAPTSLLPCGADDILAFGGDPSGQKRTYTLAEFTSFYERLAVYQVCCMHRGIEVSFAPLAPLVSVHVYVQQQQQHSYGVHTHRTGKAGTRWWQGWRGGRSAFR